MEGFILVGIVVFCFYLLIKHDFGDDEADIMKLNKDRNIICPHCQAKGSVTTRMVKKKVGIHGGKATAALLTAGISLLGTGLSRKDKVTEAHCSNCDATWYF
jgi:hypothetical protein